MIEMTSHGLHLTNSILWFDALLCQELNFLSSSSDPLLAKSRCQYITTEETKKLLELKGRKIDGLVCQYLRPFSIGHIKLELLPAGSALGDALLYVEWQNRRLLYMAKAQTDKNALVHHLRTKKADVLVVAAHHSGPLGDHPQRKKEFDRLIEQASRCVAAGQFPTIMVEPCGVAQELIIRLSDAGVALAVHPAIHKINRVYTQFGAKLGPYPVFTPKKTKNKVAIVPYRANWKPALTSGPTFWVDSEFNRPMVSRWLDGDDQRFIISSYCDAKGIKSIMNQVEPEEVYFCGPYANGYADLFKSNRSAIKFLHNQHQPPLL